MKNEYDRVAIARVSFLLLLRFGWLSLFVVVWEECLQSKCMHQFLCKLDIYYVASFINISYRYYYIPYYGYSYYRRTFAVRSTHSIMCTRSKGVS